MAERQRIPVNPGRVEWSGDNPGIYLKDSADGDWTSLAVCFRVTLSPHGRGRAMVVLGNPNVADGHPTADNLCITDNPGLFAYLKSDFLSHFPTFQGRESLLQAPVLPMSACRTEGDLSGAYSEIMECDDLVLRMTWREIGKPFAVEVGPDLCATKRHDMYSLFMEARAAEIAINDRLLPGRAFTRPFFGRETSTAFLAFSETWVTPNGP
ncbi:MAG: hypothetical protein AAF530_16155 [Pseudomonadota bacterium]